MHSGSEHPDFETLNMNSPTSLRVSEWSSKQVSTAERASKATSVEQAIKWAVQANEHWTSKWPSTYVGILGLSGP